MKRLVLALVGAMAFLAGAVVISHAANSSPPPAAPAPVSTVGPTSCIAYMQDEPAKITFSSSTLNVQSLCPAFVQNSGVLGELWNIGQPPGGASGDQSICDLKTTGIGGVVHAVVQAAGGASAAGIEGRSYGEKACTSLLSSGAGWVEGH
jgi:hypothetical protein